VAVYNLNCTPTSAGTPTKRLSTVSQDGAELSLQLSLKDRPHSGERTLGKRLGGTLGPCQESKGRPACSLLSKKWAPLFAVNARTGWCVYEVNR
jgi:hypothetical protein